MRCISLVALIGALVSSFSFAEGEGEASAARWEDQGMHTGYLFEIGAPKPNSSVGLLLDQSNLEAYVQVYDQVGPLRQHVGTTYSFGLSESAANMIEMWSQQQTPFLVQRQETPLSADRAASMWLIKDFQQSDIPWTMEPTMIRDMSQSIRPTWKMFSIDLKGEQAIQDSILDQFPIPISIESEALEEAEEIRSLFVNLTQRVDELSDASDSDLQAVGVTLEELKTITARFPGVFRVIGDIDPETRRLLLDTTRTLDSALSILDLDFSAIGVPDSVREIGKFLGGAIELAGRIYGDISEIFTDTRRVVVIIDEGSKPYTELSVYRKRLAPEPSRIVAFANFSLEERTTDTVRLAIDSEWAFWACDSSENVFPGNTKQFL